MSDQSFTVRRFSDDLTRILRERILSGDLESGDRLNEVKLAEQYGISRSPVRESLQALAAEGLVQLVAGRGAFVGGLDADEVLELGQVREAIECHAARLITERASAADIDELARSVDELEDGDPDEDFHRVLLRLSRNTKLEQLGASTAAQLRLARSRSALRPGRLAEAAAEHREIVAAIRTGDVEQATAAMRAHVAAATESASAT